MLRKARILVVFAALFAAACVPETETFLSDPGAQPLDARLVGTWYWLDRGGSEAVLLTVYNTDDKRFDVIWTELKPGRAQDRGERPVRFVRYTGHTTRIGKATFINLTLVDRKSWGKEAPNGTVVRYWIGKEGLRIALMNDKAFTDAVKQGRLPGRLIKNGVIVTAKRDALIAFMRQTGFGKSFETPTKPLRRMTPTEG